MSTIILRYTLILFLLSTTVALSAQEVKSPLQPLVKFFEQFDRSLEAFISGESSATAFYPLDASVNSKEDIRQLRKELKQAQVSKVRQLSLEFELTFRRRGVSIFYLRTGIMFDEISPGFIWIEGRSPSAWVEGEPLNAYTGMATPFRESALSVFNILISHVQCEKLPFITKERLSNISMDQDLKEDLIEELELSKKRLEKICAYINSIDPDEVYLRIDDQAHIALNEAGVATGIIQSGFRLLSDGRIGIYLVQYQPFKK